jgi:ADP-ribosylglycohydrolase
MKLPIYDKIYGCLAASWVGSAMGAITEGMSQQQIEEQYGLVDSFVAPPLYRTKWSTPQRTRCQKWSARYRWRYPYKGEIGITEDGIERQKLISTAIIEKGGRITASDLARVIRRDADMEKHVVPRGYDGDIYLYPILQAGLPANYLGMFAEWAGKTIMTRSCHPVGLINACNPKEAARDAHEVGMIYQPTWTTALWSASGYAAAISEACRPESTIESVIDAARAFAGEAVTEQIDICLDLAATYDDPLSMRAEMNDYFAGMVGPASSGEELVAKGLAIFKMVNGDSREAIIASTNFGRDTDCLAAIAAGLCGAYTGIQTVPEQWLAQVEEAERKAPDTVSNRSCKDTADGILQALKKEMARIEAQVTEIKGGL